MGEGRSTSSPWSTTVSMVASSPSMPPTVQQSSVSGSRCTPFSSASSRAMRWRRAGMPVCRVYLPLAGSSCRTRHTAATTAGGVANEGTPWPRLTQPPMRAASWAMSLVAEAVMARTRRLTGSERFMGRSCPG